MRVGPDDELVLEAVDRAAVGQINPFPQIGIGDLGVGRQPGMPLVAWAPEVRDDCPGLCLPNRTHGIRVHKVEFDDPTAGPLPRPLPGAGRGACGLGGWAGQGEGDALGRKVECLVTPLNIAGDPALPSSCLSSCVPSHPSRGLWRLSGQPVEQSGDSLEKGGGRLQRG